MNLGPLEIAIIAIVIFALFGYKKLPDATRAIGRSLRIFKGEMKGMKDDDVSTKAEAQTVRAPIEQPAPQPPVAPPAAETVNKPHTPPSTAS
jgi:TatA/E family protein of Tat protein translocase